MIANSAWIVVVTADGCRFIHRSQTLATSGADLSRANVVIKIAKCLH